MDNQKKTIKTMFDELEGNEKTGNDHRFVPGVNIPHFPGDKYRQSTTRYPRSTWPGYNNYRFTSRNPKRMLQMPTALK